MLPINRYCADPSPLARMKSGFKDSKGKVHKGPIRIFTLNERATKFRNKASLPAFNRRGGSDKITNYIVGLLPRGAQDTRSLGRDRNATEIKACLALNKGSCPNKKRKSNKASNASRNLPEDDDNILGDSDAEQPTQIQSQNASQSQEQWYQGSPDFYSRASLQQLPNTATQTPRFERPAPQSRLSPYIYSQPYGNSSSPPNIPQAPASKREKRGINEVYSDTMEPSDTQAWKRRKPNIVGPPTLQDPSSFSTPFDLFGYHSGSPIIPQNIQPQRQKRKIEETAHMIEAQLNAQESKRQKMGTAYNVRQGPLKEGFRRLKQAYRPAPLMQPPPLTATQRGDVTPSDRPEAFATPMASSNSHSDTTHYANVSEAMYASENMRFPTPGEQHLSPSAWAFDRRTARAKALNHFSRPVASKKNLARPESPHRIKKAPIHQIYRSNPCFARIAKIWERLQEGKEKEKEEEEEEGRPVIPIGSGRTQGMKGKGKEKESEFYTAPSLDDGPAQWPVSTPGSNPVQPMHLPGHSDEDEAQWPGFQQAMVASRQNETKVGEPSNSWSSKPLPYISMQNKIGATRFSEGVHESPSFAQESLPPQAPSNLETHVPHIRPNVVDDAADFPKVFHALSAFNQSVTNPGHQGLSSSSHEATHHSTPNDNEAEARLKQQDLLSNNMIPQSSRLDGNQFVDKENVPYAHTQDPNIQSSVAGLPYQHPAYSSYMATQTGQIQPYGSGTHHELFMAHRNGLVSATPDLLSGFAASGTFDTQNPPFRGSDDHHGADDYGIVDHVTDFDRPVQRPEYSACETQYETEVQPIYNGSGVDAKQQGRDSGYVSLQDLQTSQNSPKLTKDPSLDFSDIRPEDFLRGVDGPATAPPPSGPPDVSPHSGVPLPSTDLMLNQMAPTVNDSGVEAFDQSNLFDDFDWEIGL